MIKILSWVVLGLIAGALGKLFMPGKDPGGILITILIGIAGALVGGVIASNLLGLEKESGGIISAPSVIISTAGAILLLWLYRFFTKKKK